MFNLFAPTETLMGPNIILELVNTPTLHSSRRYNVTNKQEITNFLNNTPSLSDTQMRIYHGNKRLTTINFIRLNQTKYEIVSNQSTKKNSRKNRPNRPNSSTNFSPNTCIHLKMKHAPYKADRTIKIYPSCDSDNVMNGLFSDYTFMMNWEDNEYQAVYNPNSADTMGLQKAVSRALASKSEIKEPHNMYTHAIPAKVTFMRNHYGYLENEGKKLRASTRFKQAYRNTWDPNHPMMQKRFPGLKRKFNNIMYRQG
jgi:hypothetical protein